MEQFYGAQKSKSMQNCSHTIEHSESLPTLYIVHSAWSISTVLEHKIYTARTTSPLEMGTRHLTNCNCLSKICVLCFSTVYFPWSTQNPNVKFWEKNTDYVTVWNPKHILLPGDLLMAAVLTLPALIGATAHNVFLKAARTRCWFCLVERCCSRIKYYKKVRIEVHLCW